MLFLKQVLFSAVSGWWKIADFGLTSRATSRRLNSTSGARGKPCYRAPELLRERSPGFNKKVDIWSLGCIAYELCVGRKAFRDDFDTYEFAMAEKPIVIEFPEWFNPGVKTSLQSLIQRMLEPDHEKRPSVARICSDASKLIAQITSREPETLQMPGENFFIGAEAILSTDVPSEEGYHSLRWEIGYPISDKSARTPYVERCRMILNARKTLLGSHHPNTFWSQMCLAWSMYSAQSFEEAVEAFTSANEVASKTANTTISECKPYAQFGLASALEKTTSHENTNRAHSIFQELLAARTVAGKVDRLGLAIQVSSTRQMIRWRGQLGLGKVMEEQKVLLGDGHIETLETQTFIAMSELFSSVKDSTSNARNLLATIAASPTRLFRIEHPGLLTLCDLAWGFAGKPLYRREAIRIFNEARAMQQKLLALEYPSTTVSLEALAEILGEGPITWSLPSLDGVQRGNNYFGNKGILKCILCRSRKVKVSTVL